VSESVTTYAVDDAGVALVQLDRPESRNAINTAMLEQLLTNLEAAREDEAAKVLVISSTDHMGLSAGADIREDLDQDGLVHRLELFARLYDEITGFAKPTVAACHGSCIGGGAEIAVACDLRVGGSNLRIRFPGAALGLPVGPARLVTLCGLSVAKYLLLTAREVGADEALRWGLVHKVVPAARTEEAAVALAAGVASNPPQATAGLKSMLHEWDRVEERSHEEGRRHVEWLRSGGGFSDSG
jgi:enoyl-CoA hydratase